MDGRERLCAACHSPSPGPTKRLYYQHRNYGPFFPILEEQRRKSNGVLFSAGRVVVCTGCANHLLRQWSAYEQKWTPVEKRSYSLRSEEREAHKMKKDSMLNQGQLIQASPNGEFSKGSTPRRQPFKQAVKKVESQNKMIKMLSTENISDRSPSSNETFPPSFITEESSPFQRAVKQVSKQNTRVLNEPSKISDVYEAMIREQRSKKEEKEGNRSSNEIVSAESNAAPSRTKSSALWNLPNEDIRFKVREELQENIEVMIRKLAEIQHLENMRRYEEELKEAAQRICRAQDRDGDIDRTVRNLKKQLQEELMFRDTSRVLRDSNELNIVPSAKAEIGPREPESIGVDLASKGVESVTAAKRVGAQWKGKVKKERHKRKSSNMHASDTRIDPLRSHSETIPRDLMRAEQQQLPRSAHNLDAVLRELEQEREWRKKTENAILRQRDMIEDLRKGIQDDVKRLIDEQNKRYQDLKETLVAYERAKTVSSSAARSRNRHQPLGERTTQSHDKHKSLRGKNEQSLRSDTWLHDDVPSAAIHNGHDDYHSNDGDDDQSDDGTDDDSIIDDDGDSSSAPHTPEFYIH